MDNRNKCAMRALHLEKVTLDNCDDVTKLNVNKNGIYEDDKEDS